MKKMLSVKIFWNAASEMNPFSKNLSNNQIRIPISCVRVKENKSTQTRSTVVWL